MKRLSLLAGFVVAAVSCGKTNPAQLDGGTDGPAPPDASDAPPAYPACEKLDGSPQAVPLHAVGQLAGADLEAPPGCAQVDAAFGVESAGPDSAIALGGLTPGQAYVVKLDAPADLGFYVITGCSTPTGADDAECLLFEDNTSGPVEVGAFTATSDHAWVVVDFYQSSPPPDGSFALDVYPRECSDDDTSACTGATPVCVDGRCAACSSSFDCADAAAPVCDEASHTCGAAAEACSSDDANDPANNGPAGASVISLDVNGQGSFGGKVCAANGDVDFLAFDVDDVGETWEFHLVWTGPKDLDLAVFDATGNPVGLSFYEHPETVTVTFLPPGRYYLSVTEFANAPDDTAISYSVTAKRTTGAGCTSSADCAAEFRNQIYRGACVQGSCVAIDGDGSVPEGGACDRESDCEAGLSCPSFFFTEGADTRDVCARGCDDDSECAPLGGGFVCTTYLQDNFCVEKCTDDLECPTAPGAEPTTPPWFRLTCDVASGRCLP